MELGITEDIARQAVASVQPQSAADGVRLMDFAMAAQWASGAAPSAGPAPGGRQGVEACLVALGVDREAAQQAVALCPGGDGMQAMEFALAFNWQSSSAQAVGAAA